MTRLARHGTERRLPARVRDAIHDQQRSSERLIGWIQLAVVSTFAALYILSPKTFDSQSMFAPVPWVLAAYFTFTLIRLAVAHRAGLPGWMLHLSSVMDIALLLGLIWTFHLQYGQPASFYLKVPTLLYVFIFISLRALQFQARFVLVTGVTAAAGWLTLVAYAMYSVPGDPMLTRNYVEYMTSNSILLGAEFDKVISILMVTGVLALAITRARALLVRAVVDATTADDLSQFVPREVIRRSRSSDSRLEAGQGEVREATILFMDIEGFTTLSERLSPQALISTLNEYFAVVSAPLTAEGGVINQFQGDAILATFNVPDAMDDHAGAAVRAAIAIQRALATHTFGDGHQLASRIGINSGMVVGGLVGASHRLGYTVHGDEVNLAARLETLNKDHGTRILVSDTTRLAAGAERYPFRRIGRVEVRGRQAPAQVYAVEPYET